VLKSNWEEVGAQVTLKQMDFAALLQYMNARQFQALLVDFSGRVDPGVALSLFFDTRGSNNNGNYHNPQVDALLAQGGASGDQAERTRIYRDVQRMVMEDAAMGLIDHPSINNSIAKNVANYALVADGSMRLTAVSLQK